MNATYPALKRWAMLGRSSGATAEMPRIQHRWAEPAPLGNSRFLDCENVRFANDLLRSE